MEVNALSALALTSLMNLANPNPQPVVGEFELPAISGLWRIELPSEVGCQEHYNFGRDGALATTSGAERTVGDYRFSYVKDFELPILAMRTERDNNAPDCMGNQIDQTGNSFAVFVKLDSRHAPTTMQWCNDAGGRLCHSTLRRVLP